MGSAGLPCGSSAIQKQLWIEPSKGNLRVCIHIRAPWASAQPGSTIKEIGRYEMLGIHVMCLSIFAWTYFTAQRDMNIHNFVASTCLPIPFRLCFFFYLQLSLSIPIYSYLSLSISICPVPIHPCYPSVFLIYPYYPYLSLSIPIWASNYPSAFLAVYLSIWQSTCLSLSLSLCLSLSLSVYLFCANYLSFYCGLSTYLTIWLSIRLFPSASRPTCSFIHLFICLSVYICPPIFLPNKLQYKYLCHDGCHTAHFLAPKDLKQGLHLHRSRLRWTLREFLSFLCHGVFPRHGAGRLLKAHAWIK